MSLTAASKPRGTLEDVQLFSWDSPNPDIIRFVEAISSSRSDEDSYRVDPIGIMVPGRKNDPLYMLHTYWAKKPFDAIATFIEHFTSANDLVLDPFAGCGGTALVAQLAGRYAIAIDVCPSALKVACGYNNNHPFEELESLRAELLNDIWKEIGWLFKLDDVFIKSIVISEKFRCIKCFTTMPFADLGIETQGDNCPICGDRVNSRTLTYLMDSAAPYEVELQSQPLSKRSCGSFLTQSDDSRARALFSLYGQVEHCHEEDLPRDMRIPQRLIDLGGRLQSTGIERVSQLFSKRQRLILSGIKRVINGSHCSEAARRSLEFVFSAIILNSSQMYRARKKGGIAGAYYVPPIRREIDSFRAFVEKYDDLLASHSYLAEVQEAPRTILSCQSAADLQAIRSTAVDYIFTDPPYADTMPFAALNAVYDYWLGVEPDYQELEAVGDKWNDVMAGFFHEAHRVLKPGRWITLCYHDTSEGTWDAVQDLAAEAGFICDSSETPVGIDANQKAFQQTVADKVTKRDLVINFRKPRPGEISAVVAITGDEDQRTFSEKVRTIVRDYLDACPGSTKDRVYDEVVSRMVRKGEMQAHNFEEFLRQVAEEVTGDGREASKWYLKETELSVQDTAEQAKEDTAAASLRKFILDFLKKHPEQAGVHYSDLFEHYVYAVKDKPRRQLADWLLDYFYKTDEGTYRLPASPEEEQLKADGRKQGTNRRVKRYLAYLEQGVPVPDKERPSDATLAEWIRNCRRSGMYLQGKLLFEKGGLNKSALTEEQQAKVEEDYETCARYVARAAETESKPSRRKRTEDSQLELDE